MSLTEHALRAMLNSAPLYRPTGMPRQSRTGVTAVFADETHFEGARGVLAGLGHAPTVTFLDTSEAPQALEQRLGLRFLGFPFAMNAVHRDVVVVTEGTTRPQLNRMVMAIFRAGRQCYALSRFTGPPPDPFLFEREKERIREVVGSLADEASRNCYVGRLKALVTGEPGYAPMSPYYQYWHPVVRVQAGMVVCDGGIGTAALTPVAFARGVGPSGRVFGFEPIPAMCRALAEETAEIANIEMLPLGLWSEPGKVEMHVAGNVSTLRPLDFMAYEDKVVCDLTSIDAFFGERSVAPGLIKLDIEGAEIPALRGAEETIRSHAPMLQVCLYHSIEDFLEIPLLVRQYYPSYRLFVGHHTPFYNECVLYAVAAA